MQAGGVQVEEAEKEVVVRTKGLLPPSSLCTLFCSE